MEVQRVGHATCHNPLELLPVPGGFLKLAELLEFSGLPALLKENPKLDGVAGGLNHAGGGDGESDYPFSDPTCRRLLVEFCDPDNESRSLGVDDRGDTPFPELLNQKSREVLEVGAGIGHCQPYLPIAPWRIGNVTTQVFLCRAAPEDRGSGDGDEYVLHLPLLG